MNYKLSKHAIDVIAARSIKTEWIDLVFDTPSRKDIIAPNEVHYFKTIADNEERCLKVVFNPISMVVITVYFDRNMRKRGCK